LKFLSFRRKIDTCPAYQRHGFLQAAALWAANALLQRQFEITHIVGISN
jgi:hypothetical protein